MRALRWRTTARHFSVCEDSEIYPPQLRAIDDYPTARYFIDGDLPVCTLTTCQLAVVGAGAATVWRTLGTSALRENACESGLTITSDAGN